MPARKTQPRTTLAEVDRRIDLAVTRGTEYSCDYADEQDRTLFDKLSRLEGEISATNARLASHHPTAFEAEQIARRTARRVLQEKVTAAGMAAFLGALFGACLYAAYAAGQHFGG